METTPPSINNEFVAVTNGSTLYVLARATGAILYQQRLGGAPSAGPGVSEIDAVVPLSNGIVEAYKLKRERLLDHVPLRFSGTGSATTEPLIIKDRALWSTEQGYIYSRNLEDDESAPVSVSTITSMPRRPIYRRSFTPRRAAANSIASANRPDWPFGISRLRSRSPSRSSLLKVDCS